MNELKELANAIFPEINKTIEGCLTSEWKIDRISKINLWHTSA